MKDTSYLMAFRPCEVYLSETMSAGPIHNIKAEGVIFWKVCLAIDVGFGFSQAVPFPRPTSNTLVFSVLFQPSVHLKVNLTTYQAGSPPCSHCRFLSCYRLHSLTAVMAPCCVWRSWVTNATPPSGTSVACATVSSATPSRTTGRTRWAW